MRHTQGHHGSEAPFLSSAAGQSISGRSRFIWAKHVNTPPAAITLYRPMNKVEDFDRFYHIDNRPAQPAYGAYMHAVAREAARFEVRHMWWTACVST